MLVDGIDVRIDPFHVTEIRKVALCEGSPQDHQKQQKGNMEKQMQIRVVQISLNIIPEL